MLNAQELQTGLQHCTGTSQYFKHPFGCLRYTDGIQYLAKNAECYWLIDAIDSYQPQLINQERKFATISTFVVNCWQ
jgi:hypothetical protein